MMMEKAVFAGGCFWCTEAIFQRIHGVISIKPGYTGGTIKNPCYRGGLFWTYWTCRGSSD